MEVRRTVTGFAALAGATLFAQVLGFFVLTVITRRLPAADVGAFNFALALTAYFGIPANLGITTLAVRDLAGRPGEARAILGEVAVLQAVLASVPYAALVVLAPVLAPDEVTREVIPIVGLAFVVEVASAQWVLYGRQRFAWLAAGRVLGALAFAVLVLAAVDGPGGAERLGWVHVAGGAAAALLTLAVALRSAGRPRAPAGVAALVRRLVRSVPLGVAAVMTMVYVTIDHVMLGWLEGTEVVAQYAIAYKIPLAVLAVASLWGGVLLPHMTALAAGRRDELREQLGWFMSISVALMIPLVCGALLVGAELMPQLFGGEYEPSGTPFVLLMLAAGLVLVTMNVGTAVLAVGDERQSAVAVTCGAAINVVVNLAAIPLFGMVGAAVATIAAETVVLAYLLRRAAHALGRPTLEADRIARSLVATAAMTAAVAASGGLVGAMGQVAVGIVVYTAVAVPLHVVRPEELRAAVRRPQEAT